MNRFLFLIIIFCCCLPVSAQVRGSAADSDTTKTIAVEDTTENQPLVADLQPEYPGGLAAMYSFLAKNLKYPNAARLKGIEGKVIVRFTIDTTGKLVDPKIVKDPGYGLGEEALRVLMLMPKWKPGELKGKKVRVWYTLPINFELDGEPVQKEPVKNERTKKKRRSKPEDTYNQWRAY
jgi:protein TonB